MMRLTILGSGTNVHPTRAAAGYLVQTDQTMLLDFGPRTLMNLIKTGIDRNRITHVLFSHFHADHFSDFITFFFDALIYTKHEGGRRPDLILIGPKGTKRLIQGIMTTFPGFLRPPFTVHIREVEGRSFRIGDTVVTPKPVVHVPDLNCLGYRLEYNKKTVVYSGDAQYCDSLIRLCRDADVAVLDCSFPANKPGPVHMHAGECGRVARQAGVDRLVLSHLYPVADREDVKGQAAEEYGGRIRKGRDLLTIEV
ncbi:MAG: ribonuclease Z [Nitrospira sp.]|nr:ribonuclease Z [Nitrospira sp.]